MRLHLRSPQDNEWRICRMLLPETFADVSSRQYLLGMRDEAPHIVAAASFRPSPDAVTHLRLHVVPSFRRRGVGSQIVAHLVRLGSSVIEGTAEITKELAAEKFSERNRFERVDALTTVETEMAGMREYMSRLRSRMTLPAGVSTIPLSAAPVADVARLHAEYVAHEGEPNPWRALMGRTSAMAISPVITVNGQVAGILLGEIDGATAVVRSRVVSRDWPGGWVNALLLAEALDWGWAHGARRARFSFNDSNRDTQKLAARFSAEVVSVVARFVRRELSPQAYARGYRPVP